MNETGIPEGLRVGSIWRHFKGTPYRILLVGAVHTENEERLVVYCPAEHPLGKVWARPLSMWVDMKEDPKTGEEVQRFTLVS